MDGDGKTGGCIRVEEKKSPSQCNLEALKQKTVVLVVTPADQATGFGGGNTAEEAFNAAADTIVSTRSMDYSSEDFMVSIAL